MSRARTTYSFNHTCHTERPPGAVGRAVRLLGLWRARLRDRHELSMLRPEQMRDVGLDPEMVRRESQKPFWIA
jgi:uncharacterized protein YjiS (DUF1127 family)